MSGMERERGEIWRQTAEGRSGHTGGQDGAYRGSVERTTAPRPGATAHVPLST